MRFLLVLLLGVCQSDGAENVPQAAPGFAQDALAPPQAPVPGEELQQLIPNQLPLVPHDDHAIGDGARYPDQPEVFMAPDPTAADPLQNFGPHHGSQPGSHHSPFGSHHGRPDPHRGGPHAPFGMSPGQHSQGGMPGGAGCPGCRAESQFFGGDSFASGPSCPSCQTCPTPCPSSCQTSFGCPCCLSCSSLFGCWHLCNCCDPCTRKRLQAKYCHTPGDMYPESPYCPVNHGNYYFRPYTWSHIGIQQNIAARWGADPRAPYQSQVFCYLYEDMGIPLPFAESEDYTEVTIPRRDRKPSDYFTTVP